VTAGGRIDIKRDDAVCMDFSIVPGLRDPGGQQDEMSQPLQVESLLCVHELCLESSVSLEIFWESITPGLRFGFP